MAAVRQLMIEITLTGDASSKVNKLEQDTDKAKKGFEGLGSTMQAIAGIGFAAMFKGFASKAIEESNRAENALLGFKTVVKNTLGSGEVEKAGDGVQRLFEKLGGSMDVTSIQASVKNLLGVGFDMQQSLDLVEKNAYMASINRQSQFKTIAEAVQTYTEGIKNNNAQLTDSTGISENLSVTLKKMGLKMDDLNDSTKKAAVLRAIYSSHTKEASQYEDAFTKQMEGFQGQVIKANAGMTKINQTLGDFLKVALNPVMSAMNPLIQYFSDSEKGVFRLKIAVMALTPALLFLGITAIGATVQGIYNMTEGIKLLGVSFNAWLGWAVAIGVAITAIYIVFEDLYIFAKYGIAESNTLTGEWLQNLGFSAQEIEGFRESIQRFFGAVKDFFTTAEGYAFDFAVKLDEAFTWISESIDWVVQNAKSIFIALLPVIGLVTPAIIGFFVSAIGQAVVWAIATAVNMAFVIGNYIVLGATAIATGIQMAAAWLIGLGPIGWVMAAVGAVIALFYFFGDEIEAVFNKISDAVIEFVNSAIDWLKGIAPILEVIGVAMTVLGTVMATAWLVGLGPIGWIIAAILGLVGLFYMFQDEIIAVFDLISEFISNFMDSIIEAIDGAIGWVMDFFGKPKNANIAINKTENVTRNVSTITKPNLGNSNMSTIGENGFNLPSLDGKRASGGPVSAGKLYQVNENGVELFVPNISGNIIPSGGYRQSSENNQPPKPNPQPEKVNQPILIQFGDIIVNGDSSSVAVDIKDKVEEALNQLTGRFSVRMGIV